MRFLALCWCAFWVAIGLQAAVAAAAPAPKKAAPAAPAVSTPASSAPRPFHSSADPNADPNKSLKSCLEHAGLNPVARDRCMRQHCEGHWGQGDCPASGGNFWSHKNASSHTPLGQCLNEAGMNPFKRNACGWKYCRNDWNTPECAQFQGDTSRPN
jgi:hypothetical protein